MANKAAVLGTGQTRYVAKRTDVSMNGLVREAIDRALADSGATMADIDAVVVGKAPDFFEGVMMPELFMSDATGSTGKPLIRCTPPVRWAARPRSSRPAWSSPASTAEC
ncbi:hypothetical protein MINS_00050 [Mycolicibacterium insubricum]|nr:hypothetical protein MINS_00050 [Mycolicibacterium insubricum]